MFDRLIIGTANWRKPYNGCICKDQDKILEYCHEFGINMIETAVAYGTHEIWPDLPPEMDQIVKTTNNDTIVGLHEYYCAMQHDPYAKYYQPPCRCELKGLSLYPDVEIESWMYRFDMIEFPYSIMDRRCEKSISDLYCAGITTIARSIYLRGKCLEIANPQECLAFVLCNRNIDYIIIGCDSYDQLRENTDFIHEWEGMRCDDEQVVDPRRWPE